MTTLIASLFSTQGVVAAMLLAVLWWSRSPASRTRRRVVLALGLAYLVASIYAVPYGVGRLLVVGYHPLTRADVPPGRAAIVILGSGESAVEDWDHTPLTVIGPMESSRVLEGSRVAHLLPDAWVVSSGGAVSSRRNATNSGTEMSHVLVRLGVPASRILIEKASRSTRDQAMLVAAMLQRLQVDHVVLVTSDFHMRRSLAAFRGAGVQAIPAIVRDHNRSHGWSNWLLPTGEGLGMSGFITHELVGLAYYGVRGWL